MSVAAYILISLEAVVHCSCEQRDTAPYIGSFRSWEYAGILLRLTTHVWHQEVALRRTGGMERN